MGELIAVLSANRKNALCPGCRRVLAYRTRQNDGAHLLFCDPDWGRTPPATVWTRNWRRWEDGRRPRHRALRAPIAPINEPSTRLLCGCGETVLLDPVALDATVDLDDRYDMHGYEENMSPLAKRMRIVRPVHLEAGVNLMYRWPPPREP